MEISSSRFFESPDQRFFGIVTFSRYLFFLFSFFPFVQRKSSQKICSLTCLFKKMFIGWVGSCLQTSMETFSLGSCTAELQLFQLWNQNKSPPSIFSLQSNSANLKSHFLTDSSSEIPDKVDAASQSYYSYQATTVEPFQDESSFPNKAGASPLVLSESRSNTRQFTSRPTAFFTPKSEWKETTNSDPFGTTPRYRDIAEDRPRYAKDPAYQDLPWPAVVVNRHTTKPKQRPTQRRQATYPAYAETSNPFNNRK